MPLLNTRCDLSTVGCAIPFTEMHLYISPEWDCEFCSMFHYNFRHVKVEVGFVVREIYKTVILQQSSTTCHSNVLRHWYVIFSGILLFSLKIYLKVH